MWPKIKIRFTSMDDFKYSYSKLKGKHRNIEFISDTSLLPSLTSHSLSLKSLLATILSPFIWLENWFFVWSKSCKFEWWEMFTNLQYCNAAHERFYYVFDFCFLLLLRFSTPLWAKTLCCFGEKKIIHGDDSNCETCVSEKFDDDIKKCLRTGVVNLTASPWQ